MAERTQEEMRLDALKTLQRIGNGTMVDRLYEALVKTATEVVETGNPGTVTLTLKLGVSGIGDPFVVVAETIGRASPKRKPRGTFLFAMNGEFFTDDPRQTRFDMRDIDRETGEIREVPTRGKVERVV